MTSSRALRQQETRERLLTAAASVVAERGYGGASIDLIAREAGFTKGAVYANFESKEALLLALLDRYEDHWVELYGDLVLGGKVGDRAATQLIDADDDRAWTLLEHELWMLAMRNAEVRSALVDRQRRTREALAARFAAHDGRARAEPRDLDSATVLMALGNGLAAQRLLDPATAPASLVARAFSAALGSDPGDA